MDVFLVRFESVYDAATAIVAAEDESQAKDLAEDWLFKHHEHWFSRGGFLAEATKLNASKKGVLFAEIIGYD